MKKISYYFLAALSILAVSSCAKDILEVEKAPAGAARTFVLDLGSVTRTNITEAGKTIWAKGDKVLLTDGAALDTIAVPEAAEGQPTAEITTTKITGETVYAIYPIQAVASTTPSSIIAEDGTVNVKIPADQGGDFADANIMVGKATDLKFAMKNVAAVLKIHAAVGVEKVVFNASGDALAGKLAVSFGEDNAVSEVKASGTTGILTLNAMGGDADFYVAVAPGTYKTGFNLIALDNEGKFESKKTGSENTLKVNELADLGVVGAPENMKGFEGEGTEAAPYKIGNIGEMMAFANTVNTGKKYKGKNFKLSADIPDVTLPIGYYISADNQGSFAGTFDGDNHTITVDLDAVNCKSAGYVGLFGVLDSCAVVKNVNVAGTVKGSAEYVAGLVAYCRGSVTDTVWVSNCTSSVKVESTSGRSAGIAGYSTYTVFDNCKNTGSVTAGYAVGGIVGYGYQGTILNSSNEGVITGTGECGRYIGLPKGSWRMCALDGTNDQGNYSMTAANTKGVGGIIGYAQNVAIKTSKNTASVNGVNKVGGIAGTEYWSNTTDCVNSGAITASADAVGGIVGWVYVQANTMNDINSGTITGRCAVGGLVGMANSATSNASINIRNGKNTGAVNSVGGSTVAEYNYNFSNVSAAGGIVGLSRELSNGSSRGITALTGCENTGDVTGAGIAVGGIVGYSGRPLNNVQTGYIQKSKNSGKVSGLLDVGGIAGIIFHRFTSCIVRVSDCENSGDVISTSTEATKCYVGGIVGWTQSAYPAAGTKGRIYNDINTGNVIYSSPEANPYAGGIVGNMQQTEVYNVYNSGAVKPASGSPAEGAAALGGVAGYIGAQAAINYSYFLSGTAAKAIGTTSATPGVNISEVNAGGDLVVRTEDNELVGNVLNIFDNDCSTVVDALNAWSDKNSSGNYYYWAKGPVFTKE
ncbi:MAG: hypothetical protein MJY86_04190 [Bacteroidales bacterium]|nr:hypothetical protein [Bacteroidales bacterium]